MIGRRAEIPRGAHHDQLATVSLAFGLLLIGGDLAVAQTKTTTIRSQCYTDDGYGRVRPCSQGFKKSSVKKRKKKAKR